MIKESLFFDEVPSSAALWCAAGAEDAELARAAQIVVADAISVVSVAPDAVARMWPWLENMPVKIMARFYLSDKADEAEFSDLAVRINNAFKHGAHGAQIFVRYKDLRRFADAVHLIRDDLFFNKDLSIGMDINDISVADWTGVFNALSRIRATSLILAMTCDDGDKSDFVGRVYAMLESWGAFAGDVHFKLGESEMRMEQAWRLIQAIRPALVDGARFFVMA